MINTLLTLHSVQAARERYLGGVWQQETLYTMVREHARARPNACALRDQARRLTWREVYEGVETLAQDMHERGLRRGDRVAVWLPSCIEVVLAFLACSRNGYVCCPSLHQNYTVAEIIRLLGRVRCRALFAQPGYGADAIGNPVFEAVSNVPTMRCVYAVPPQGTPGEGDRLPAGAHRLPDRSALGSVTHAAVTDPDKVVYLAFTSGTTGEPKGVLHSDNTLLANGRALVSDWRHDAQTVLLTLSPMSHHIGTVALEQALVAGLELVMYTPAPNRNTLDWILESGATYVMGVPTHAMDLLGMMRSRGLRRLGNVRTFYMAGSSIPRELAQQFLDIGVTPQNVYGMTENGSHQYTQPTDSGATIVATCGRACSGYEVKIFDQEDPDVEAPPGEVGEIGSRGALLMLGYYDNQDATEAAFNASGWFMSGDLGRLDEQGCLHVVGRKKDLIIRGGHNIHPAPIEDLAHRHPGVLKAAAFPIADERLGERVCLAVICQPGVRLGAQEMLRHLRQAGLSKYDMPEYFIRLDEFPMTASGKILKRGMADWMRVRQLQPQPVRSNLDKHGAPA